MGQYFEIHFKVYGDSKEGYSIFVDMKKLSKKEDVIKYIKDNKLYEDEEDLENIDYFEPISKKEYKKHS